MDEVELWAAYGDGGPWRWSVARGRLPGEWHREARRWLFSEPPAREDGLSALADWYAHRADVLELWAVEEITPPDMAVLWANYAGEYRRRASAIRSAFAAIQRMKLEQLAARIGFVLPAWPTPGEEP